MSISRNNSSRSTTEHPSGTREPQTLELDRLLQALSSSESSVEQQALASFLENSPDPILLFNEKAELIAKNQRAAQFWDGANNFIPPQLISEVSNVHASGSPFHEHKKNQLISIKTIGEKRYFLPTLFPLFDKDIQCGSIRGKRVIACILKDQTMWERSERIRNNLFASISHELNTPLTSARVALYLLAEQRIGELNPTQLQLVEGAKHDLEREIRTIQNVIDMIRSEVHEPDQADTEQLNLHKLIEEAITSFEPQFKTMSVPVHRNYASVNPWIKIECDTAEIVIHQLFVSILKYTGENTILQVDTLVEDGHCSMVLTAEDGEQVDFPPKNLFNIEMESQETGNLRCADLGLRVAHEMIVPFGGSLSSELCEGSGKLRFRFPLIKT